MATTKKRAAVKTKTATAQKEDLSNIDVEYDHVEKQETIESVLGENPNVSKPKKKDWVIKDRMYRLKSNKTPISKQLKSRGIFWFDKDAGYERELKYTTNQRTVFVDEFQGQARLAHVYLTDGQLFVPKEKQTLQKLLSIYHPDLNKIYYEYDKEIEAEDELEILDMEYEALTVANESPLDLLESILRTEIGSEVNNMTSKEIKKDAKLFAKRNPSLFIDLARDENIVMRNVAIKATEDGIISLSPDGREFKYASNGRTLIKVPFDENPYSALAAWFKTDEGMDVYRAVEKRLYR